MTALAQALDALVLAGVAAGLDAAVVREEGTRLAAAVAESIRGAGQDWLAATGETGGLEAFFTAASRGRRWRSAPTDQLSALAGAGSSHASAYARALTEVVSAASALGDPDIGGIASASATAAAQLAAVPGARGATPTGSGAAGPADGIGGVTSAGLPAGVPGVDEIIARLRRTEHDGPQDEAAPTAAPEPAPEAEPLDPPESIDDLLAELDALIGLDRVKSEIKRQTQLLRIDTLRQAAGLSTPTLTRHLVFTGNPGTGKTTVARLVSRIYRSLGILSQGVLVEVDRSELVAGYLGQTATKTAEVIASARGGILFIDEAYALALDQYGAEAVTTLVKDMEDHRGDLVVIVAGYSGPMQGFLETNPGLASRFSTTIDFADYSDDELSAIFRRLAASADFEPTEAALAAFAELASAQQRTEAFGNGRWVRNVLDAAITRHAWRLRDVEEPTLDELRILLPEDVVESPADAGSPADATGAKTTDSGLGPPTPESPEEETR
ncbi:AAA family ATPase [Rathayibacter rathayi]|uniref:AAA family ATPase n=1 Tax=Rathayibacter rathayi TaxID=33887 RepID=UPI000BC82B5B|nr:AAA family ATPase [Rathayibacter rathayi]MWV74794.1 AAA family ATPase [Rathayibacter rathayi NCPPB 2980 = VKM Ac-1601]PPF51266.1 AAA family ATPase [Rathayibacter rathayi]PPG70993.1 AAA family ATPase [Rathayibacter rathayi]PPG80829.1 AAA family ATPase [Rathayibacter rathayi]PPH70153.1 AAA family ATPase [Rathayibacter rathayi]